MSDFLVVKPSEKRIELWASSIWAGSFGVFERAVMTWEGVRSPEAQAEPVETKICSRSR